MIRLCLSLNLIFQNSSKTLFNHEGVKLNQDFYEKPEEKKWKLRKEALDDLLALTENSKIQLGDFTKSSRFPWSSSQPQPNVNLVALAWQCGLAKGLRNNFKQHANNNLSVCLEKFKEKKLRSCDIPQELCWCILQYSRCRGHSGDQVDQDPGPWPRSSRGGCVPL